MTPTDLPRAIRLVETGTVSLGGLITDTYGLEDWRGAFDGLVERSGLKVVVEPGKRRGPMTGRTLGAAFGTGGVDRLRACTGTAP
jgi:hypothetical protein